MKTALIGYTGFVGSNLLKHSSFTDLYNSKNIAVIKKKKYDLIVSVGNSSFMWKANLEPEVDLKSIQTYMDIMQTVKAKHFVLFSTIEVYDNLHQVNEDSPIDQSKLKPYGKHRYMLEEFIKKHFEKYTIIRLTNLFGPNLKKNFVYDLIYNNRLDLTHKDSMQQWYNLKNIWKDLNIAVEHDIQLINFAVEPVSCRELAHYTLGIDFTNVTKAPPRKYDIRSKYANLFHSRTPYLYQKKDTLVQLKDFIQREKSQL